MKLWGSARTVEDDPDLHRRLLVDSYPAEAEQAIVFTLEAWFGMVAVQPVTPAVATGPEMQWRHLNVMNFTCHIHATDPLDERHCELPWLGQPGLPFSNGLLHQVFSHGFGRTRCDDSGPADLITFVAVAGVRRRRAYQL